ncbi:hypothetical protein V8C86DRAFT_2737849 [Haematococcus lacustris]
MLSSGRCSQPRSCEPASTRTKSRGADPRVHVACLRHKTDTDALPSSLLVDRRAAVCLLLSVGSSVTGAVRAEVEPAGTPTGFTEPQSLTGQTAPAEQVDLGAQAAAQEAPLDSQAPAAAAAAASPPQAPGPPSPAVDSPAIFRYSFASSLPSNLRVKEYWAVINKNRPPCWQRIASLIQGSQFAELSEELNQGMFADMRYATLHIPWALLQRDDFGACTEARKAFNEFNEHVQDLQAVAVSAAAGDADAQRVQQAFILMSASLDSFLTTVPNSYLGNGPKA